MIWVLTGFMGCGKTSVGRLVASLCSDGGFIDLDEQIESSEGRSIPEIFATVGEAGFRAIERDALAYLLQADRSSSFGSSLLIGLGGGTLTNPECREMVKKHCRCIYLRGSVRTLAENLRGTGAEGRPMLAGVNPEAPADAPDSLESRIASLMAGRGPIYEEAADVILDIDGLSIEEIARRVSSLLTSSRS